MKITQAKGGYKFNRQIEWISYTSGARAFFDRGDSADDDSAVEDSAAVASLAASWAAVLLVVVFFLVFVLVVMALAPLLASVPPRPLVLAPATLPGDDLLALVVLVALVGDDAFRPATAAAFLPPLFVLAATAAAAAAAAAAVAVALGATLPATLPGAFAAAAAIAAAAAASFAAAA